MIQLFRDYMHIMALSDHMECTNALGHFFVLALRLSMKRLWPLCFPNF